MPVPDRTPAFSAPYVLLIGIPAYRDTEGEIWLDELWHHDLLEHFKYLPDFRLACPILPFDTSIPNLVRIGAQDRQRFKLVDLPPQRSTREAILNAPRTIGKIWSEIGRSTVLHSGVAGWPIPLGWFGQVVAIMKRATVIVVVESAPWRLPEGTKHSFFRTLRSNTQEGLGRWIVNQARLTFATHQGYLDTLATKPIGKTFVVPASWIREENVRSQALAEADWKARRGKPLRIVFLGRLVREKGVLVLLEALQLLAEAKVPVELDLVGQGPLMDACRSASERWSQIGVRETVRYGEPLFELLREYDCVVVPTVSDEQPRVIFDAFSQAIPVIASKTKGNSGEIRHGETGWLVAPGDAQALADQLRAHASNKAQLEAAGLQAREVALTKTHTAMHAKRAQLLCEHLESALKDS